MTPSDPSTTDRCDWTRPGVEPWWETEDQKTEE